jgi:[protein-PII] uridylyltransferase
MKIFEESACLQIPLSIEAKRLAREFKYLIDDNFISSLENVQSFESILTEPTPTFNVLNEMLNTGMLTRYLPEFKNIENRIQYDEYHLYPVDRHSLRAVQILKSFGTKEGASKAPLCGNLYKELKNRRLLLWATLFHDIGKGAPGESHSKSGAKIVRTALTKRGFKNKEIETVSFLVEEHLVLFKTATRRDLYDEETAIFCARIIKDARHLKMLYLLTVADAMATGPKAWNEWTATLLKDLFFKVLNILEHGELATREAVTGVEEKKKKVLSSGFELHPKRELETLFNFMSPRYLLYTSAEDILEHIKLYQNIGADDFVWRVVQTPDSNSRTVTICAKDRPGLISKIAGTFTLNSLDILNVQVFTWRNNIALDIFEVKPPPDRIFESKTWERAAKQLRSALADELDLAEALRENMNAYRSGKLRPGHRPHKIVLDNNSSSFFTIVEVFTYDFPGLLYSITDALFRCRLDVWVAKISTKIDQVVDVFYVRDFDGQKVDSPDQVAAVKAAIEDVLP